MDLVAENQGFEVSATVWLEKIRKVKSWHRHYLTKPRCVLGLFGGHFLTLELNNAVVPWALTGALLFNLVTGLATTSIFHRKLTPIQRLENALTSFILLDLCEVAAIERARQQKIPKSRVWLASTTQKNLQDLCGAVAIACTSLAPGEDWAPWRSSELPIEQHFGHLRLGVLNPNKPI